MQSLSLLIMSTLSVACISSRVLAANTQLREVIVSHTDANNVLQLYRIKEDGSSRRQITYSKHACLMPAVSPDGQKIVYVQQSRQGMTLRLSDLDGKNSKSLTPPGKHLMPSWLPDSQRIVWMLSASKSAEDPARNSQLHIMNTETLQSKRLFSDPEQIKYSNGMPVVSPDGKKVAFVSNRNGNMRIWVSDLDGSNARLISPPNADYHEAIQAPIEQKVPAWSPDGRWIAYWEGVEMTHMSKFTGISNPERDRLISATFHVWVVSSDGNHRRKIGRGDDPTWSPDGFVTRAFPNHHRGGPKIMIACESGEKQLPIVPPGANWGRFAWIPQEVQGKTPEGGRN